MLATVVGGAAAAEQLARFGPDGAAERGSVPAYGTVEEAVRALALVHAYAEPAPATLATALPMSIAASPMWRST